MFNAEQEKVRAFFELLLDRHGTSPRALAYGSKESQQIRFEALTQVTNLDSASLLDVGCGFADLYDFLCEKGLKVRYVGCDISAKMIGIASSRHPELDLRVVDILDWEPSDQFDYVVGTGFNCVPNGKNELMIKAVIEKMYQICRRGVAVGMVSSYQKVKTPDTYYADPEKLFTFCMNLCGRVVLRHDYLIHDFTLYLYRSHETGTSGKS